MAKNKQKLKVVGKVRRQLKSSSLKAKKSKGKGSRKGKKEWRANISTEDIEDFYAKSTKDALSGGDLAAVPTDSLFFLDNSQDLSVRRKTEKMREKVLRCDSVLQKNPFVKPVLSSKTNKSKYDTSKKKKKALSDGVSDPPLQQEDCTEDGFEDLWGDQGDLENVSAKPSKQTVIPAVEVEPPGCSFNPEFQAHQDSLAQAVAEEMHKVYREELGPQPVPLVLAGKPIDEEDMLFLEADQEADDENEEQAGEGEDSALRTVKTKRITRVELNKRARRKEVQKKELEERKKKQLSEEIGSLPDIMQDIAKEDEEKQKKRIRRMVAKQERLKVRPPRLGKHKFEPAPTQVLLSEEINGSLRKLKGCCTLLSDRFKSLEKRGLIPPVPKSRRK